MAEPNRIGQLFGNYRLIRLLGEGGFAEVYLGEHIHLGMLVAIKVLRTKFITREQEDFLREARTIAFLEHPSIIRMLDCGIDPARGEPFLIMTYAPNGTLRQRYPRGTYLPIDTIVPYVKQMASALYYAHEHRLVHRDVKPENMLLGPKSEVLLSDFGIALISSSSSSQNTTTAAGTVAYMAPEQIMGKPRPSSDQYALAVVTYEWLSGITPFYGSFNEMCAQHLYAPPPSLREMIPELAPEIEQTILKALAKDPQERFPNIEEFALALEQSLQAQVVPIQVVVPASSDTADYSETLANPANNVDPSRVEAGEPTLVKRVTPVDPPEALLPEEEQTPSPSPESLNDETDQTIPGENLDASAEEVLVVRVGTPSITPPVEAPRVAVLPLRKNRSKRGLVLAASVFLVLLITSIIFYVSFAAGLTGQAAVNPHSTPTAVSIVQTPTPTTVPTQALPTPTAGPVQRQLSEVKTAAETVHATGQGYIPAKAASGAITFVPHDAPPVVYPAGTTITLTRGKGKIDIVIDEDVNLPYVQMGDPGDYNVTVPAHVKQAGTIGNIEAGALNQRCCRGSDRVYNASAFSGGSDVQKYVFVKQSDIKNAAYLLKSSSTQQATQSIQADLRPDEHLVGNSQCSTQTVSDHAVGEHVSNVTVQVTATCTATAST